MCYLRDRSYSCSAVSLILATGRHDRQHFRSPVATIRRTCVRVQEPAHGKLPDSCTSEPALAVAKDQVYLAYGMSFAMQFRDSLRLAPDPDATSANVPAAVKSKTAIKSAAAPPDDADWRRLVKLLRLVSEDWFTEARRLINSKRRLCSKIEHFPAALRSGGSLDFADRVLAMLGSAAVPRPEKQAFVSAVLKFNHAVLFAELGFAWAVRGPPSDSLRCVGLLRLLVSGWEHRFPAPPLLASKGCRSRSYHVGVMCGHSVSHRAHLQF